jgi:hypothetical protein
MANRGPDPRPLPCTPARHMRCAASARTGGPLRVAQADHAARGINVGDRGNVAELALATLTRFSAAQESLLHEGRFLFCHPSQVHGCDGWCYRAICQHSSMFLLNPIDMSGSNVEVPPPGVAGFALLAQHVIITEVCRSAAFNQSKQPWPQQRGQGRDSPDASRTACGH